MCCTRIRFTASGHDFIHQALSCHHYEYVRSAPEVMKMHCVSDALDVANPPSRITETDNAAERMAFTQNDTQALLK